MTDDLNDIDEAVARIPDAEIRDRLRRALAQAGYAGVLCAEHHIPMYWDEEARLYRCWERHRSGCGVTHAP